MLENTSKWHLPEAYLITANLILVYLEFSIRLHLGKYAQIWRNNLFQVSKDFSSIS